MIDEKELIKSLKKDRTVIHSNILCNINENTMDELLTYLENKINSQHKINEWHRCEYGVFNDTPYRLIHDGTWEDGKFYEWIDIYGNKEIARMKKDAIDHFFPPTKIIKEINVIAYREIDSTNSPNFLNTSNFSNCRFVREKDSRIKNLFWIDDSMDDNCDLPQYLDVILEDDEYLYLYAIFRNGNMEFYYRVDGKKPYEKRVNLPYDYDVKYIKNKIEEILKEEGA